MVADFAVVEGRGPCDRRLVLRRGRRRVASGPPPFAFFRCLGRHVHASDDTAAHAQSVPLLSNGAMADHFYTKFESCTYENACFTVKNLAVYEKAETNEDGQTPAAILPELTVRAVNLEGL